MIQGGNPPGFYAEAIDPTDLGRTYVETDIPIPQNEVEEPEQLNQPSGFDS